MTHKQIEEQFHIFFSANTERAALAALSKLKDLGLSEQQILDGIKAGCDYIKNASIEEKTFKFRRAS